MALNAVMVSLAADFTQFLAAIHWNHAGNRRERQVSILVNGLKHDLDHVVRIYEHYYTE
jgi:hypothetical protein